MSGGVRVVRGEETESVHRVSGVVVGASDGEESGFGDPSRLAYWRSSMKPFQALPLVEDGAASAFDVTAPELALCCASHVGSPSHVEGIAKLMDRLDLAEDRLHCGPHPPFDEAAARAAIREEGGFRRIHNNCSGKHAGMMALARHHGWPVEGYAAPDHPVQARIRRSLARWLDVDPEGLAWASDGCGVPTPRLSLRQMARAFSRLRRAVEAERAPAAVVGAMTAHPELVSGPGRPVTRLMEETGGRVIAKEGAEGVFCVAGREGWGLALKVEDGARRAATPAVVQVLARLELITEEEAATLDDLRAPAIENTRGEPVGRILPEVEPRPLAVSGGP